MHNPYVEFLKLTKNKLRNLKKYIYIKKENHIFATTALQKWPNQRLLCLEVKALYVHIQLILAMFLLQ